MEIFPFLQKQSKNLIYGCLVISIIIVFVVGILLIIYNTITIDTFVNFITGFSTLLATVFILVTLFEMREQRLSTYKPAIFVKDSAIMVKWDRELHSPLDFSIEEKTTVESKKNNELSKGFECYNIGLGAAQKIQIFYNFDLQKMIEKIKELDKDLKVPIKFKNSTLIIGNEWHLRAYPEEITDKIRIDYILPTNIDSTPIYIPLPSLFIDLFSVYLFLLMYSSDKLDDKIAEVNKCNLIMKYQDIGNELYVKKFEIELFLMMYQGDDNHKFSGSLIKIRVQ